LYPQGIECGSLFSACPQRQAFFLVLTPRLPLDVCTHEKNPRKAGFSIDLPMVRRRAVMMRWRAMVVMRRHTVAARDQTAMYPHPLANGARFGSGRHKSGGGCGQQHQ
jgi:hypothetical protein